MSFMNERPWIYKKLLLKTAATPHHHCKASAVRHNKLYISVTHRLKPKQSKHIPHPPVTPTNTSNTRRRFNRSYPADVK